MSAIVPSMDILFMYLMYLVYGILGPLLLLFVLALLFGKRIKKQWEYEAEFCDEAGREFGEFDIEMYQIEKDEPEPTFQATFKLRHTSIEAGQRVEVYVDDVQVMAGNAQKAGHIFLQSDAVVAPLQQGLEGQVCRVVYGGRERFAEPLRPD